MAELTIELISASLGRGLTRNELRFLIKMGLGKGGGGGGGGDDLEVVLSLWRILSRDVEMEVILVGRQNNSKMMSEKSQYSCIVGKVHISGYFIPF